MDAKCPKCGAEKSVYAARTASCDVITLESHLEDGPTCLRNQLAALQAKYDRAVKLLRVLEGQVTTDGIRCVVCNWRMQEGHALDCELSAIINQPKSET